MSLNSEDSMKILKIFGLGSLFLFLIFIGHAIFGGHRTTATPSLSALLAGTIFNPYFLLAVLVAYGTAFFIVRRR